MDAGAASKHGPLWALALALATASKLEVAIVLPWARVFPRDRYDVELEDGTVVPAVREELLRARDKDGASAEERKEGDRPLRPGARVEVDGKLAGRVVHVGVFGALDVAYDHGETEICVSPATVSRLRAPAVDAVVAFDADGSGRFLREARVVRKRRPRGPAVERYGFRDSPLAVAAVATTSAAAAAQLALKIYALARGGGAIAAANACTNAAVLVAIAKAAYDVAIRRANALKRAVPPAADGGMELWDAQKHVVEAVPTKTIDFDDCVLDFDKMTDGDGDAVLSVDADYGCAAYASVGCDWAGAPDRDLDDGVTAVVLRDGVQINIHGPAGRMPNISQDGGAIDIHLN